MAWAGPRVQILVEAVDRASATFVQVGRSAGLLQRALGGLSGVARMAAGYLTGMLAYQALGAVEEACRGSIEAFMDFEAQMARVVAASGAVGVQAEALSVQLGELARTVGVELGVGANRAAEALLALVKAGFSGAEAGEALRAALRASPASAPEKPALTSASSASAALLAPTPSSTPTERASSLS